METANQGDNIFLTRRSALPPSPYCAKDLNEDMRASPTPDNCARKEITSNIILKHRSRGAYRPRARSSPVRSALSKTSSPERRARSPSVSATRIVFPSPQELPAPTVLSPHDSLYTHQTTPSVPSATSYFSPHPPSIPLYIVPLPSNPRATAAQIEKNVLFQRQSKEEARNKTSRRIARQLLYSIFKQLPINTENVGVDAVGVKVAVAVTEPGLNPRSNRSIATQALTKNGNNRKKSTEDEDECSSSESSDGCVWAGSVRALRNSHVRLVLRQLRHLRDIERLGKALRREHSHE